MDATAPKLDPHSTSTTDRYIYKGGTRVAGAQQGVANGAAVTARDVRVSVAFIRALANPSPQNIVPTDVVAPRTYICHPNSNWPRVRHLGRTYKYPFSVSHFITDAYASS